MKSNGRMVKARLLLVLIIRMRLPIISRVDRVPMRNETWATRCTAEVSLERRTMSWPVLRRSILPNEKDWIFRNSASRISRAMLSPTLTDRICDQTAKRTLKRVMPSIRKPVLTTTC